MHKQFLKTTAVRLSLVAATFLVAPLALNGVSNVMGPSSASLLRSSLGIGSAAAKDEITNKAVAKAMSAAQKLSEAGKYSEALVKVKEADKVSGKSAYEAFVIDQFMYFLSAKTGNYAAAEKAAEGLVKSGRLSAADRKNAIKSLAQMYYQTKNYSKATAYIEQYQKEYGADAELQALQTQGAYVRGDYKTALADSRSSAMKSISAGRKPDETVLQVWLSSAFKMNDKASQADALERLMQYYPKPTYFNDFLSVTTATLPRTNRMTLEVYRLKLAAGLLKSSDEYVEMGQLAIQQGLPGEAQSVIATGNKNGTLGGANKNREQRLLAMANTQAAKDKPTLPASAGTPAAKAALAEAYATYGNPQKAIELYKGALSGGNADEVRLHLGQAYLMVGNKSQARATFNQIKSGPYAKLGSLWSVVASR